MHHRDGSEKQKERDDLCERDDAEIKPFARIDQLGKQRHDIFDVRLFTKDGTDERHDDQKADDAPHLPHTVGDAFNQVCM